MPIDRNGGQYITANPQQPTQSSAPGIWDIDEQGSAQAAGRWPLPPNVVQRSLRFNSADATGLNWTPSSAGNQYTFTTSMWVKRSGLGSTQFVAAYYDYCHFGFDSDDTMYGNLRGTGGTNYFWISSAKFRDPSAWYHLVFVVDTANATSTNRFKFYVNGVEQTFSTISYPTQNLAQVTASIRYLGRYSSPAYHFNGYMAEINFVDGQALTPSSFGQTDAQTGQWIPRVYSGSYGTNGFRLQFLDNSGTTATTLGKDTSGMGNNWTPSGSPGFSVAAGSGNDSLRDVPMNYYSPDNGLGGEVIGNYCTWNPIYANTTGVATLSNGNLDFNCPNTFTGTGTMAVTTGKWYWEITPTTNALLIGIKQAGITDRYGNTIYYGGTSITGGGIYVNGNPGANFSNWTVGDVIGVAPDMDGGLVYFYKNGVLQGSVSLSSASITAPVPAVGAGAGLAFAGSANFGQRPFAYTAPSGFKALCTQNLPWTGTITTSGTFTGNASTDGPFVYLNGIPTAMTINGNAVTFGTQADKLSNGFKVRSSSASYNASGSNTYSVSTTGNQFSKANAQANP